MSKIGQGKQLSNLTGYLVSWLPNCLPLAVNLKLSVILLSHYCRWHSMRWGIRLTLSKPVINYDSTNRRVINFGPRDSTSKSILWSDWMDLILKWVVVEETRFRQFDNRSQVTFGTKNALRIYKYSMCIEVHKACHISFCFRAKPKWRVFVRAAVCCPQRVTRFQMCYLSNGRNRASSSRLHSSAYCCWPAREAT